MDRKSAILDVSPWYKTGDIESQDSGVGGTGIPEVVNVMEHIQEFSDVIRLGSSPKRYNLHPQRRNPGLKKRHPRLARGTQG